MAAGRKSKKKRGYTSLKSHPKLLKALEKDDKKFLNLFISHLKKEHKLTDKKISELLTKEPKLLIPATLFETRQLSPLEALTKFLKENKSLTYHKIASLLNRDDRTIWTTYQRASKKYSKKLSPKQTNFFLNISIFKTKLTVFESLVKFLKESSKLSFHEIALLLNRNDRTIWTVYSRSKLK